MKINKTAIFVSIGIAVFLGFCYTFYAIHQYKIQFCIENPVECEKQREATRKYLEEQRKKGETLSCGPTMPGMSPGWGGWKCEYDD